MVKSSMEPFLRLEIRVPAVVVDQNGHVNNVAYVQWMQEVALRHSAATGCTRMTEAMGATWVARMHRIEYLRPAFAGDDLTVLTWVADFRKVRSLRRYRFIRDADEAVIAEGETDWVFIDVSTGRPRRIPKEVTDLFKLVPDGPNAGWSKRTDPAQSRGERRLQAQAQGGPTDARTRL